MSLGVKGRAAAGACGKARTASPASNMCFMQCPLLSNGAGFRSCRHDGRVLGRQHSTGKDRRGLAHQICMICKADRRDGGLGWKADTQICFGNIRHWPRIAIARQPFLKS
jgi:hypothetical protein